VCAQAAERAVSGLHFFGLKHTAIMPFVEKTEYAMLAAGVLFAFIFPQEAAVYGFVAVLVFFSFRVAALFFDMHESRKQLVNEVMDFLQLEIAVKYATDTTTALVHLKSDLTEAIANMADTFCGIPGGAEQLALASEKILSASDLLAAQMKGHAGALSEQLFTLVSAIEEMKAEIKLLHTMQSALAKQSGFIETNQAALQNSLHAYETSLQDLTRTVGDGLGAFINLHSQTAAQTINDAMRANIDALTDIAKGRRA